MPSAFVMPVFTRRDIDCGKLGGTKSHLYGMAGAGDLVLDDDDFQIKKTVEVVM